MWACAFGARRPGKCIVFLRDAPRNESAFLKGNGGGFGRTRLQFKAFFRRLSGAIAVAPPPKAGAARAEGMPAEARV